MKRISLQTILYVAVLVAMEVVLSRFLSINTTNLKIGLGFVPIAVCGALFGPLWAAVAGAMGDFLGAVLFPVGPYFPGFTLTAALTGLCFGLFLYREKVRFFPQICCATAINCIVLSLGLNSVWISVLYGTPIEALIPARAVQCAILIAVYLILLPLLVLLAQRLNIELKKNRE